jgi:hypothetical protein
MSVEMFDDGCSLLMQIQVFVGGDGKFFLRCDALKDAKPDCIRLAGVVKIVAEAELRKIDAERKAAR